MIDAADSNQMYFYHFDRTGSTLALTDSNGAVTDSYAYSPYGQLLKHEGSSVQPFTFVGKWGIRQEGVQGQIYQVRARYYDSQTARFLSREPLWPSSEDPRQINPYQYALNEPVSHLDVSGFDAVSDIQREIRETEGQVSDLRDSLDRAQDALNFRDPLERTVGNLESDLLEVNIRLSRMEQTDALAEGVEFLSDVTKIKQIDAVALFFNAANELVAKPEAERLRNDQARLQNQIREHRRQIQRNEEAKRQRVAQLEDDLDEARRRLEELQRRLNLALEAQRLRQEELRRQWLAEEQEMRRQGLLVDTPSLFLGQGEAVQKAWDSEVQPVMWTNAGLFQFGVRVDF
jgi:RHS repeat-associated protein